MFPMKRLLTTPAAIGLVLLLSAVAAKSQDLPAG